MKTSILLLLLLALISGTAAECCQERTEPGGDSYIFNSTSKLCDLPAGCSSGCLYHKAGDTTGELFCFGAGDILTECSGEGVMETVLLISDPGGAESYPCDYTFCGAVFNHLGGAVGAALLNGKAHVCDRKWCYANTGNNGKWKEIASLPTTRDPGFSMTALGSYILIVGGYSDKAFVRFDGNSWTTLETSLTQERRRHCAVAISDTEMILVGGDIENTRQSMEKYDVDGNLVETLPSIAESSSLYRGRCGCALFQNSIYLAGGEIRTQDIWEFTREVVVYNLATNQWTPINQMNQKRFGLTMEVLNGKLTVFGGIQHRRGTMEEYDGENWIEIDKGLANQYFDGASVVVPCQ